MGVRATNVDHSVAYAHGRAGALAQSLEARLSAFANLVVVNSEAGKRDALARGFPAQRTVVIPNGIDTVRHKPDRRQGEGLRAQWGGKADSPLIGMVARLHPMKDHTTFLKSAALLAANLPHVRFVCVGDGADKYAAHLRAQSEALGLAGKITWAGRCTDMASAYNALDMLCLSSANGEGFPNVLGEAMSCGVPCCATDVGDCAQLLGPTGVIVPPLNPTALAAGMTTLLDHISKEGDTLRQACRKRITGLYTVENMVAATETEIMNLLHGRS
jgi:glycosyltransferase involved in cell wall biosynthesis